MKLQDINPLTNEGKLALLAIQSLCEVRNREELCYRGSSVITPEEIMAELVAGAGIKAAEPAMINQDRAWEVLFKGHATFEADTREQAVALALQFENRAAQAIGLCIAPETFYQCLEGISHEVIGHCEISEKPIFTDDDWKSDGEVMWLVSEEEGPLDGSIDIINVIENAGFVGNSVKGAECVFQARVRPWLIHCFGEAVAFDTKERNHRFLEEALELVQSIGGTRQEALMLVEYVFSRPLGEPFQEVGGVMVTLAALCIASGLNMHHEGDKELGRIWGCVDKIRAKQATKPHASPLPGINPKQ